MAATHWIRITHIPTGISVSGDNSYERSMHKTRLILMKLLQSKIYASTALKINVEKVVRTYSKYDFVESGYDWIGKELHLENIVGWQCEHCR